MTRKPVFILAILSAVFFVAYLWLATPISTGQGLENRFDWPDETANYFWIKNYAAGSGLVLPEPLNLAAANQIHPRSFNVRPDGALVPGSFLGLILIYGALAKIFSAHSIIYFTPVISILAVLTFYKIIKRIFDSKVALVASLLMLFAPAWWYYSVTSLLPNVLFVSLVIFGVYFLIIPKQKNLKYVFSALFFALAIAIRPAEIVWLLILLVALFIYLKGRLKPINVILFIIVIGACLTPFFYEQKLIYGNVFTTGYSQLDQPASACQVCRAAKALFLPFGFNFKLLIKNFWQSYIQLFWWFSVLALLGLVVFFSKIKKLQRSDIGYLITSALIGLFLALYYGSWQFSDQLTVNLNTIGLSYIRYWLPLYLLALPLAAIGLIWLSSLFKKKLSTPILILFLLFLSYQSAAVVLWQKPDSILPVKERIALYKSLAKEVTDLTEAESVIISVRKDKVFFPERKVIHTFDNLSSNPEILAILPQLIKSVPVYYYAPASETGLAANSSFNFAAVKNIQDGILYKISLKNKGK